MSEPELQRVPSFTFGGERVSFIAEVGPNHNGDLGLALEMIDVIAEAGADAVKFQTFASASTVVARNGPLADYMKRENSSTTQDALLEKIRLSDHSFSVIAEACRKRGIGFLSTPFDEPSVALLQGLGVSHMKIPSGEITNPFLLKAIAATGLPVIMSTGMADLDEIDAAIALITRTWRENGVEHVADKLALLHCTSAYPTRAEDANLKAMDVLRERFALPVGFSDHTIGWTAPLAAAARGAVIIEKHVTKDTRMPGPDHAASLPLHELKGLIAGIRDVETVLGRKAKALLAAEEDVLLVARRSLAARLDIAEGDAFSMANLQALRPATGIPAMRLDDLVGIRARRAYAAGDLIAQDELPPS